MYLRLDRKIGSTEHHFGKKADRLNLFSLSSVAAWFCLGYTVPSRTPAPDSYHPADYFAQWFIKNLAAPS